MALGFGRGVFVGIEDAVVDLALASMVVLSCFELDGTALPASEATEGCVGFLSLSVEVENLQKSRSPVSSVAFVLKKTVHVRVAGLHALFFAHFLPLQAFVVYLLNGRDCILLRNTGSSVQIQCRERGGIPCTFFLIYSQVCECRAEYISCKVSDENRSSFYPSSHIYKSLF